ncbi:MAG: 50S ribosomal protein L4 [Kiritimatiellae bacterium]|nr:50S ribosomal protein L4 [Kiritimatiellia bacterium]MDD4736295.1 50S ribosomal protein L4 [Kiritimatiellia bacterium]
MSKIPIRNMKGEQLGEYELADSLLEFDKGLQAMHDAVVAYLANQRNATASTLSKGEVAGSNRKLWKQKGTGRARTGRRQSPVWRGGGVAFGPKPRRHTKKLTKKMAQLAFRRAVSEKVTAGQMLILDELSLDQAKTKEMQAVVKNLAVQRGALFLVSDLDTNVALATRNLQRVELASVTMANTYQVLRYPTVVVTKKGMGDLESRLQKKTGSEA